MIERSLRPARVVFYWVAAMGVSALYFVVLDWIAPVILTREGRANHSDLYALADRNYQRVRELRWVLPEAEKIALLDQAIEALEEAARQRPESRDYQWYLGQTLYLRAHQVDPPYSALVARAVEVVNRVWELTGREWGKPGAFLVDYYTKNGQTDRAITILERLLSVHPESPDHYGALLDLLLAQDRYEEALALLQRKEEWLSLSPSDLDQVARLNLRKGDYSVAIEALNRLVAGGGGDSRHRLLLAGAHRMAEDYDEAFQILHDFVKALGSGTRLRAAKAYRLDRYPSGLFPPLAYLLLEGRLAPLP